MLASLMAQGREMRAAALAVAVTAWAAPAAAEPVWYDCRFSGDFEMTLQLALDRPAQRATV